MGRIIFEFGFAALFGFYFIVDIFVPSFTKLEYFWFLKACISKPKPSFEQEVKDAEKTYRKAKNKMEHLKDSAKNEREEAEKNLTKAQEVFENAKKKIENFNTKKQK